MASLAPVEVHREPAVAPDRGGITAFPSSTSHQPPRQVNGIVRRQNAMTAQAPDRLMNKHPRVKLRGLYLYGVVRGDIRANSGWGQPYEFLKPPQPPKDVPRCSALWRGYTATFRLDSDGELELVSYRYPLSLRK